MEPEGDELLAAIRAATTRFIDVARQVRAPTALLRDSTWTAAELVAHVAAGADGYARYLEGDLTPFADVSDLAGGSLTASNAELLADETERDIGVLVDRLSTRARDLCARAAPLSLDAPASFHGRPAPLRCILASTLVLATDAPRFDVTVSADPIAFLLVAYGRRSQWNEIARGHLFVWGRRPWLALRLKSYLVNP